MNSKPTPEHHTADRDKDLQDINNGYTAIPHTSKVEEEGQDNDFYGEMNLADAKESGYTDEKGHAVSKAVKDVPGHPTGAYTDVGAGRSSAVITHDEYQRKIDHH